MLRFSIKNVLGKKGVAIISSLGIGFGLMLMIVLGSFSAGVAYQFEDNFSKVLGIVQITEKNRQGGDSHLPLNIIEILSNSELGEDIKGYSVEVQLPIDFTLAYQGKLPNERDQLAIIGVNTSLDKEWGGPTTKLEEGESFQSNTTEVILDSRLINRVDFDTSIDSNLKVYLEMTPMENKTVDLKISGIYNQEDNGAPDFVPRTYYAYTSIETTWQLLKQSDPSYNRSFSSVALQFSVTTNEETEEYIKIIKDLSNEGAFGDLFVDVYSLASFQSAIVDTFAVFDAFITVISLVTAIAGGMTIVVSQLMSVNERMKEFAILKSTGWKNRHIFLNIIYESLILGVTGAIVGILFGGGLIFILTLTGSISAIVTFNLILRVIIFALTIGVLGGLYPGIKAVRVRPVRVLKGE